MRFPRATGILLHPTSLPGPNGIGEIGPEAFGFADWLAEAGQRIWQVLPLGPTGYGDSPYQCFSAFAGNPLLLSLDRLVDRGYLSRQDIARTPGADLSNSMAMIVDFVPGAYMTHDQLHIRGGHQVTWEIDGVPIPNTNIASNVGPQVDPKDIDYLEVQRGGYSAEGGDRTYGVFNVVPRSLAEILTRTMTRSVGHRRANLFC